MAGDGVAGIKRRRRDLSSDGVRNFATALGRGRLKEDLESSTWRRHQDFKATPSRCRFLLMLPSVLMTVQLSDFTAKLAVGLYTAYGVVKLLAEVHYDPHIKFLALLHGE
ncbi:hypothetical protein Tco_0012700 [Tanacetum coccineum]